MRYDFFIVQIQIFQLKLKSIFGKVHILIKLVYNKINYIGIIDIRKRTLLYKYKVYKDDGKMKSYSINLKGRVKNFPLPKNRPLIPLFEAVVNSIDAISERKKTDDTFNSGRIVITVIRSQQLTLSSKDFSPVESFIIEDNGIGFTERNMESFMESDSEYKAAIGGKGVGRFSWLKAFSKVHVSSIFKENDKFLKREFEFSLNKPFIDDSLIELDEDEITDCSTIIKLCTYLSEYQEQVPKQIDTIAMKIMQHCLVYFLDENCPEIIIEDEDERISINQLFKEKIKTEENTIVFRINDEEFKLLHVKIEDKAFPGNRLYLCANNRLVDSKDLEKYLFDLDEQIFDRNGFWYIGVLTSNYLDDHVDLNRLSFNLPNDSGNLLNEISLDDILKESCKHIGKYLCEYLIPIGKEKMERINNYVINVAPQFRHLLKYMPERIASIKPKISDDALEDALYEIKREFDRVAKKEQNELLKRIDCSACSDDYETYLRDQIKKISDANSAVLAEYVAHRRVIIELFERGLRKQDDNKFNKEKYMHSLIYPMKSTSDDIDYEAHNLWLIDEKLSYCYYISSDIPFDNDYKQERTDILVLDRPVAISDEKNSGGVFDTIIIFEIKRPMRDDYTDSDNPISQLYDYVWKIRNGEAKDKYHRPIRVDNSTKYYLYAICDITKTLERCIEKYGFTLTPDKLGYYGFNPTYNAYIEVLSYDKILNDAKKRNRVLFDKLGI